MIISLIINTHLSGAEETGDNGGRNTIVQIQSSGDGRIQVLGDGFRRGIGGEASGMEIGFARKKGLETCEEGIVETTRAGGAREDWGCRFRKQESCSSGH